MLFAEPVQRDGLVARQVGSIVLFFSFLLFSLQLHFVGAAQQKIGC
jgi:hypothetical protein